MTLKSALQDLKDTTLAAVSGLLGKLAYLGSLRKQDGGYGHWGMSFIHGKETSEKALHTAHAEVVTEVLRTPLPALLNDLDNASKPSGVTAEDYLETLRSEFDTLLPGMSKKSACGAHLSSVLVALSALAKHRGRATRSTS